MHASASAGTPAHSLRVSAVPGSMRVVRESVFRVHFGLVYEMLGLGWIWRRGFERAVERKTSNDVGSGELWCARLRATGERRAMGEVDLDAL